MEFILITMGIMTCCSLLVYKLASFFELEISPQALAFCGIASLIVNFSAIKVSSYLSPAHYILLIGMVLIASSMATCYNQYLIRRHTAAAEGDKALIVIEEPPSIEEKAAVTEENTEETVEMTEEAPAPVSDTQTVADVIENAEDTTEIEEAELETETETETETEIKIEAKDEAETEVTTEIIPEAEDEPDTIEENLPAADGETEIETTVTNETDSNVAAESKLEIEAAVDNTLETVTEDEPAQAFPVEDTPTPEIEAEIEAEIAAKDNMDDLLDYAYEQNLLENTAIALYAYNEALRRYAEDSYAPFIAIEMINIHKARGTYAEALEVYHKAMKLTALKNSSSMQKEFNNGITYVETLIELLREKNMENTPLSQIPPHLMKEIELVYTVRKLR